MDKYDELQKWLSKSSGRGMAVSIANVFVFWFWLLNPEDKGTTSLGKVRD